jgi:CBS-domain-containing membrane protein
MTIASELMTADPVVVRDFDKVKAAVQLFQSLDIRHLPVVNQQGELIGMISDRDLRGLAFPQVLNGEWLGVIQTTLEARIATVMSADPLCVDAEADAAEIVDLMLDNKVGAVPVIDAENHVVGIVSYVDMLRELSFD